MLLPLTLRYSNHSTSGRAWYCAMGSDWVPNAVLHRPARVNNVSSLVLLPSYSWIPQKQTLSSRYNFSWWMSLPACWRHNEQNSGKIIVQLLYLCLLLVCYPANANVTLGTFSFDLCGVFPALFQWCRPLSLRSLRGATLNVHIHVTPEHVYDYRLLISYL